MGKSEVVVSPAEKYLLDVCDPIDYGNVLLTAPAFARRGGIYPPFLGPVWDSTTGWVAEVGGGFRGMTWSTATTAAATLKTRFSTKIQIPIGADLTGCPAAGIWPLRYRLECIVWRVTNPLTADAPFGFSLSNSGGVQGLSDAGTFAGYELVSDSLINGGRWTARARLATAGALVVLGDSGVDPGVLNAQTHIELRYDHTTNPRLSWLINGVEMAASVLQGVANIPFISGNAGHWPGVYNGRGVAGAANQKDRVRQTRFRIEQLVGFPE